jgi:hypothetical protein
MRYEDMTQEQRRQYGFNKLSDRDKYKLDVLEMRRGLHERKRAKEMASGASGAKKH